MATNYGLRDEFSRINWTRYGCIWFGYVDRMQVIFGDSEIEQEVFNLIRLYFPFHPKKKSNVIKLEDSPFFSPKRDNQLRAEKFKLELVELMHNRGWTFVTPSNWSPAGSKDYGWFFSLDHKAESMPPAEFLAVSIMGHGDFSITSSRAEQERKDLIDSTFTSAGVHFSRLGSMKKQDENAVTLPETPWITKDPSSKLAGYLFVLDVVSHIESAGYEFFARSGRRKIHCLDGEKLIDESKERETAYFMKIMDKNASVAGSSDKCSGENYMAMALEGADLIWFLNASNEIIAKATACISQFKQGLVSSNAIQLPVLQNTRAFEFKLKGEPWNLGSSWKSTQAVEMDARCLIAGLLDMFDSLGYESLPPLSVGSSKEDKSVFIFRKTSASEKRSLSSGSIKRITFARHTYQKYRICPHPGSGGVSDEVFQLFQLATLRQNEKRTAIDKVKHKQFWLAITTDARKMKHFEERTDMEYDEEEEEKTRFLMTLFFGALHHFGYSITMADLACRRTSDVWFLKKS